MQCNKCLNKKAGCWIRMAVAFNIGCDALTESEIRIATRASAGNCDLFAPMEDD